ncbi:MAG: aldo/keto reductase [Clostridia bacterium]|nr:aldo/keto reductase [Clostridia bacterium]MBQ3464177.1 aldo/keto reductase [Clostridia bacterium]
MRTRVLGKDLEVSAVGLGCMGFTHAYGTPCDENEAAQSIISAAEMGYTFFDTAECYIGTRADGTTTYNEELVGKALAPIRGKVKIATKFGVHHEGRQLVMDSHPDTIRKAIDGSLKRLGVEYVDLYYQHRIDPVIPAEEVAGVMSELIRKGKIKHWGISETDEEYLRKAHAVCPVTCIQNRYSMMARGYEQLFPVLEELNIGYVAFSPLANGFLTDAFKKGETFTDGDYRSFMPQYTDDGYEANRELLTLLRNLAQDKNATPAQISLAWMLCKKPYIVPIPGSRKTARLEENLKAVDILLTDSEFKAIDEKLNNMKMSAVFGVNQ